jgi:hypothetical protein
MPRFANYPDTVENCLTLSTTDLKNWGYLKPNTTNSGTVTHSRGGTTTAKYNIIVAMGSDFGTLTFDYTSTIGSNKQVIYYSVDIISIPTNIGNGLRYYFVCPNTNNRAMKLYKADGCHYFLHREAYNGLMYQSQLESKTWRFLNKSVDGYYMLLDMLNSEFYRKGKRRRKTHYNGQPTKAYQRILNIEKLAERAPRYLLPW